jgi:hypothetical protein
MFLTFYYPSLQYDAKQDIFLVLNFNLIDKMVFKFSFLNISIKNYFNLPNANRSPAAPQH